MGEYKGARGVGSKGDDGEEVGEAYPPPPGIQKIVAKRMKIGGLSAIRVWARRCKRLKGKGMLRAVGKDGGKCRWRGGFSSDQPRET